MFNRPAPPYRTNVTFKAIPAPQPTLEQGLNLHRRGDLEGAARVYQALLRTQPHNAEALHLLGVATEGLGNSQQGIELMEQALAIDPGLASAHLNRANALKRVGRYQDALAGYTAALQLKPDYPMAHSNRGATLETQGRYTEAMAAYDQALELDPTYADARWNKAALCLLLGDFDRGWPLFESRWNVAAHGLGLRGLTQPQWLGDAPLAGQTLLIHAEQGLGDTIQFCRLALETRARGAKVVLEVPSALKCLLGSLHPDISVIAQGEPLPPFDLHCPIASLPLALRLNLQSIPAPSQYLQAPEKNRTHWRSRLPTRQRKRVGLVWSGNPAHLNDGKRSLPLSTLIRALPPTFDYYSLQKEVRSEDAKTLANHPEITHWGQALEDFADTAALCEEMDLIISVDTSVAHLAAALGRPTWILLPALPDWRWLLERSDSPWYPSVHLFRQTVLGQWDAPLKKLPEFLRQFQSHSSGHL